MYHSIHDCGHGVNGRVANDSFITANCAFFLQETDGVEIPYKESKVRKGKVAISIKLTILCVVEC